MKRLGKDFVVFFVVGGMPVKRLFEHFKEADKDLICTDQKYVVMVSIQTKI